MVSLEKEKKEERSTQQQTGSLSKAVNKQESVNNLLTTKKFKSELQRLRKDQLERINEIAEIHSRNSFSEVIDLLLFCYDYLEEIRLRNNFPSLISVTRYINELLPQSDADRIVKEVISLLEKLDVQDPVLERVLVSIFLRIKIKNEDPSKIGKILFEVL